MNLFIFHRDLRIQDNTTLIKQIEEEKNITPIFIFTNEQIDKKKNKYFSDNSVQFMCTSLHELSDTIKKNKGKLYFYKGDNIEILKTIHKNSNINSIGFNIDYTPYATDRDKKIEKWCIENKIKCYKEEDYALHNILEGKTYKKNGEPYLVYTPFMKHTLKLKIREINKFNKWKFNTQNIKNKFTINEKDIDKFYIFNKNINVKGGRKECQTILSNIHSFNDYKQKRDLLTYKTTFLGAHLHYTTCSIREIYHKIANTLGKTSGIIRELIFRDFYINVVYNFPRVLEGQIKGKNKSYKEKYDKIKWSYNKKLFNKWCEGKTGFPIIDAGQRQMNITGYMHNRCRMITSNFLTKDLHIDWLWGEKYFATKLVDYDPINNSQGWQWSTGNGTDAQPWFRIFNPWTQQKKFDKKAEYIKKWIPELKNVSYNDIHNWHKDIIRKKYNINYPAPIINHNKERQITINTYKKIL